MNPAKTVDQIFNSSFVSLKLLAVLLPHYKVAVFL